MLAGFLLGIIHDRRLMREAQLNLAIRWFTGYALHETLPDHSSLTRIRQRWGEDMFRRVFVRVVQQCQAAFGCLAHYTPDFALFGERGLTLGADIAFVGPDRVFFTVQHLVPDLTVVQLRRRCLDPGAGTGQAAGDMVPG